MATLLEFSCRGDTLWGVVGAWVVCVVESLVSCNYRGCIFEPLLLSRNVHCRNMDRVRYFTDTSVGIKDEKSLMTSTTMEEE